MGSEWLLRGKSGRRNQLGSSSNNLAWARVTVMEIEEVCFRGSRDGVWDGLNVEDNNREKEEARETPRSLLSDWMN